MLSLSALSPSVSPFLAFDAILNVLPALEFVVFLLKTITDSLFMLFHYGKILDVKAIVKVKPPLHTTLLTSGAVISLCGLLSG